MTNVSASFSQSVVSGDIPLSVDFTDQSTPTPQSRWWDFGDGRYSKQQNPSIVYEREGDYDVTLYVRKDGTTNVFSSDTGEVDVATIAGRENDPSRVEGRRAGRSFPAIHKNPVRPREISPGTRGDRTSPIRYY